MEGERLGLHLIGLDALALQQDGRACRAARESKAAATSASPRTAPHVRLGAPALSLKCVWQGSLQPACRPRAAGVTRTLREEAKRVWAAASAKRCPRLAGPVGAYPHARFPARRVPAACARTMPSALPAPGRAAGRPSCTPRPPGPAPSKSPRRSQTCTRTPVRSRRPSELPIPHCHEHTMQQRAEGVHLGTTVRFTHRVERPAAAPSLQEAPPHSHKDVAGLLGLGGKAEAAAVERRRRHAQVDALRVFVQRAAGESLQGEWADAMWQDVTSPHARAA